MTIQLLHLNQYSIFKQLQLEEALLRNDQNNWCIINEGTILSIVMGISGKLEELVNMNKISQSPIPIIRRFSGGGTVAVDEDTIFITFIFQKETHTFPLYPEPIMKWTEQFYRPIFPNKFFQLKENDYLIGDKKCGGNAQYIKKDRFLHHTSFLWNFKKETMDYLLFPKKTPHYRSNRTHEDFLCRLQDFFPRKTHFLDHFKQELAKQYRVNECTLLDIKPILEMPHRQSTNYLLTAT